MTPWPERRLGEIATIVRTKVSPAEIDPDTAYLGLEHLPGGGTRATSTGRASDVSSQVTPFESHDVLFGRLRPYLRKVVLADSSGVCTPEILVVRADRSEVLPGFLHALLSSDTVIDAAVRMSAGTRMPRTSAADLLSLRVVLPPLDVQRRIVDLVGALDDNIAALERESDGVGVLLAQAQNKLPKGGESMTLGDLLTAIESGTSVATNGGDLAVGSPRILKVSAVRPARFSANEAKPLGEIRLPDRARVTEGDLLMTRSNTPDRVGYVCVADDVPADTFMPDLIWRLVPDETKTSSVFLEHALSSPLMRRRITATAVGTSESMRKVNKKGVSSVAIELPSLEAQAEYVATCSALKESLTSLEREIGVLRSLRSSLLPALLSGEVEIPESYDSLFDLQEAA